jgi:iron complex transport system substrate-binding protein
MMSRSKGPWTNPLRALALLCACGAIGTPGIAALAETSAGGRGARTSTTVTIVDQAGRTVTIPRTVRKVFGISPMGAILLYTLAPEKLLAWNNDHPAEVRALLVPPARGLRSLSGWYGPFTANAEEVIKEHPDFLLSVWPEAYGPPDLRVLEKDLRRQDQLGIPVVVLDGRVDKLADAYEFLGRITGDEKRAAELARYAREAVADVRARAARIPADRRVAVYYAEGPDGLQTDPSGTSHAELLRYVNARNVAALPVSAGPGGIGQSPVSMEQVIGWDPEIIIVGVHYDKANHMRSAYDLVKSGERDWKAVRAVKKGHVYGVPFIPFNWFDRPPSANRLIGLRWVGHLVYPAVFDYDMRAETRRFYRLFYQVNLTDAQIDELLARCTRRRD